MEDNKYDENNYKEIIAKYTDEQFIYADAILDEEEAIIYNKKKLHKEEKRRRLRGR